MHFLETGSLIVFVFFLVLAWLETHVKLCETARIFEEKKLPQKWGNRPKIGFIIVLNN